MDLKTQEIDGKINRKEETWGAPRRWGGSPRRSGAPLASSFLASRFEVHLSCSVWVPAEETAFRDALLELVSN